MRKTLEKLWHDHLLDECAALRSEEERRMTGKVGELYENAKALLNKEQEEAVEKYVDALSDLDSLFAKKAFLKGCEFAVSFVFEAMTVCK